MNAPDTEMLDAAAADDDEDDSGLRWGVAGVVAALPLFGFLAWLLPAMLPPPEAEAEVPGSSPGGVTDTQKYLAFSLLYLVAFASHGFNPADGGVWGVTAASAAHMQLERIAASASVSAESARAGEISAGVGGVKGSLGVPVARTTVASLGTQQRRQSKKSKPSKEAEVEQSSIVLRGGGGESTAGVSGSDWMGGSDPWAGMVPKMPEVPRMPEVPELSAKELGRALGATKLAAARYRGKMAEGEVCARLDAEDKVGLALFTTIFCVKSKHVSTDDRTASKVHVINLTPGSEWCNPRRRRRWVGWSARRRTLQKRRLRGTLASRCAP